MKKSLLLISSVLALSSCAIRLPGINTSTSSSSSESSSSKEESSSSSSSSSASSSSQSSSSSSEDKSYDSIPSSPINPDASTPITDDFLELFAYSSKASISLDFSPAALTFISDYQQYSRSKFSDFYVPATFTLRLNDREPIVMEEVGVRMKGNTSRSVIYENGSIANLVHFKVNFKATFDDAQYFSDSELLPFGHEWTDSAARKGRKNRTLFGLEKLDLKFTPRNSDSCIAREVYCYDAFRNAGLLAPFASLCSFTFSDGKSSLGGTYEMIEPIDKAFLKKRYSKDEAKGDLYKCVYNGMGRADLSRDGAIEKVYDASGFCNGTRVANGKIGVEDNYIDYVPCYQMKTNDNGEESDFSKMANYIAEIWNVVYKQRAQSVLESVLDVPSFLRFSAVSYLLGNFDDQRYNWNNYYIYFLPSTGQAIYIPYDWDWSLGLGNEHMASSTPFDTWTLSGENACNVYYATIFSDNLSSDLAYSKDNYRSAYLQDVIDLKAQVLDFDRFDSMIHFLGCSNAERSQVRTYMATKKSVAK